MSKSKFSVMLSNPPYDNGLYKRFLIACIPLANYIISVNPMDYLISKQPNKTICDYIDERGAIIEKLNSMEHFDAGIIGLNGILYINNSHKILYNGKEYKSCKDITLYSDDNYLIDFNNIVKNLYTANNLDDNLKMRPIYQWAIDKQLKWLEYNPNDNWYCLPIAKIRGHQNGSNGVSNDYYTFIPFDKLPMTYIKLSQSKNRQGNPYDFYFAFDTYKECMNFISYLKSDFARTCLKLIKNAANLMRGELKYIPWFDFSDPIFNGTPFEIDDALFKKFNISNDIRNHIKEILPDYYRIRK